MIEISVFVKVVVVHDVVDAVAAADDDVVVVVAVVVGDVDKVCVGDNEDVEDGLKPRK